MCDEIIDPTKRTSTKAVPTKSISTNFCILFTFLLIIIVLLIAISISCCLINHKTKQKHIVSKSHIVSQITN